MVPRLVDFHCHLDLYPDYEAAVAECERKQVFTLAVTTTPRAWPRNHAVASATSYVRAALGIHPQLVSERASELGLWEAYLPEARYIGEVGLDGGPRHFRSLELQKQVFEKVLCACSVAGGKILTVHSVRSARTVLDMIEKYLPPSRGQVVLHWFTGSKSEARRAVELGCYFSINVPMMLNARHREVVSAIPIERLLTETDGPFTKAGTRPARPTDVGIAVDILAKSRGLDVQAGIDVIQRNLRTLVSM
jgi:TatD DNase family protein